MKQGLQFTQIFSFQVPPLLPEKHSCASHWSSNGKWLVDLTPWQEADRFKLGFDIPWEALLMVESEVPQSVEWVGFWKVEIKKSVKWRDCINQAILESCPVELESKDSAKTGLEWTLKAEHQAWKAFDQHSNYWVCIMASYHLRCRRYNNSQDKSLCPRGSFFQLNKQ